MFKKQEEIDTTRIDTVIGKEASINGTIEAKGVVRVDGNIQGELNAKGDIIVSESGRVEANITCKNISVAGTIRGNIEATGMLDIAPAGKLYGDVSVAKISIGDGAVFQGACQMRGQQQEKPPVKQQKAAK